MKKNKKGKEIILLKATHHTTRSGDIMNSGMIFYDRNLCLVDSATTHTILKEK